MTSSQTHGLESFPAKNGCSPYRSVRWTGSFKCKFWTNGGRLWGLILQARLFPPPSWHNSALKRSCRSEWSNAGRWSLNNSTTWASASGPRFHPTSSNHGCCYSSANNAAGFLVKATLEQCCPWRWTWGCHHNRWLTIVVREYILANNHQKVAFKSTKSPQSIYDKPWPHDQSANNQHAWSAPHQPTF